MAPLVELPMELISYVLYGLAATAFGFTVFLVFLTKKKSARPKALSPEEAENRRLAIRRTVIEATNNTRAHRGLSPLTKKEEDLI